MRLFDDSLIDFVRKDEISKHEAMNSAHDPQQLLQKLQEFESELSVDIYCDDSGCEFGVIGFSDMGGLKWEIRETETEKEKDKEGCERIKIKTVAD